MKTNNRAQDDKNICAYPFIKAAGRGLSSDWTSKPFVTATVLLRNLFSAPGADEYMRPPEASPRPNTIINWLQLTW